jgi:short-subunit dehydrogenase involved in D-alanine esterification of teichoic acids
MVPYTGYIMFPAGVGAVKAMAHDTKFLMKAGITLSTNLDAILYSNRAAIKQFLKQGNGIGTILNMSSMLDFSPSSK